jgi:hypothetical protein
MKKLLLTTLLLTTINANAGQAYLDNVCDDSGGYEGMQTSYSAHGVHLLNDSGTLQNVHVKYTNCMNGPWPCAIKEFDVNLPVNIWYHNNNVSLPMQFHLRGKNLLIQTTTTEVTGYINKTETKNCYYRIYD